MNAMIYELSLLTANVTMYKWLLGGGIGLMAILGLVVFGILALRVLQEGPTEATAAEGEEPSTPTTQKPATTNETDEQEDEQP